MDNNEAMEILNEELAGFRSRTYSELRTLVTSKPILKEIRTYNDADYNLEIVTAWNDRPDGNIKVHAFIDDGELRSFFPISSYFIKSPDNELVED
jgi:hypothetical protein